MYGKYIIAHELGHEQSVARNTASSDPLVYEKTADCYAGSAIAGLDPSEVPKLITFWKLSPGVANRSGEEISATFKLGTTDSTGDVCSTYLHTK